MQQFKPLSDFFNAIAHDPRIGASHISMYCALWQWRYTGQKTHPILFQRMDLMRMAKISGLGTFHKCIRDLHELGYIHYYPSYDHRKKSKVYLLPKENN